MGRLYVILAMAILVGGCIPSENNKPENTERKYQLKDVGDQIHLFERGNPSPIVQQVVAPNHRPYLHPILAPNSKMSLTQFSPDHHKHQTGLYWGFTRVNGSSIHPDTLKKWFYKRKKPAEIQGPNWTRFFPSSREWVLEKSSLHDTDP